MANTKGTGGTVKFNPTITAMFTNDKFGEGALLSAEIDAKGFAEVQNHLQVGSKLVLKPRTSKEGKPFFFLEILPAQTGGNWGKKATSDDV